MSMFINEYKIIKEIGSGGFRKVYLCENYN